MILPATGVTERLQVKEHRLHRLAEQIQLHRAYIGEVAPCRRQSPFQIVIAQV